MKSRAGYILAAPGLRAIEKFDIDANRLLALLDANDPYSLRRTVETHTVDLFVAHIHEGKPRRRLRFAVRPAATEVGSPRVGPRRLHELLEVGRLYDPLHC